MFRIGRERCERCGFEWTSIVLRAAGEEGLAPQQRLCPFCREEKPAWWKRLLHYRLIEQLIVLTVVLIFLSIQLSVFWPLADLLNKYLAFVLGVLVVFAIFFGIFFAYDVLAQRRRANYLIRCLLILAWGLSIILLIVGQVMYWTGAAGSLIKGENLVAYGGLGIVASYLLGVVELVLWDKTARSNQR
jgi:hypothetical protein